MSSLSLDLRPLGIGQIFDRAFRLFRQNFLKYVGIVALIQVPIAVLALIPSFFVQDWAVDLSSGTLDPTAMDSMASSFGWVYSFSMLIALVSSLVSQISNAAMARTIADEYMGVETGGIMDAYRRIGNSWISLILTLLVNMVFALGLVLWTLVPCIGWITGPGMLLYLSLVIAPVIVPVVILEGVSTQAAIQRSWDLVRSRFWWMLGFMMLMGLLVWVITQGPAALVQGFIGAAAVSEPSLASSLLINIFSQTLVLGLSILVLPFQLACIVLVYFDLRVRREGFDLTVLSAESDPTISDPTTPYDGVKKPTSAQGITAEALPALYATVPDSRIDWPSSQEFLKFAGITIGIIVLYVLMVGVVVAALSVLGGIPF